MFSSTDKTALYVDIVMFLVYIREGGLLDILGRGQGFTHDYTTVF